MSAHDLYEQRNSFFLKPSSLTRGGTVFCLLVGVLAFVGALISGQAERAWGSLLFNLFFFFSLSLGGIAFGAMQDVIGAQWGRPIKRIHEAFSSFLPVAVGLFIIFFLCIAFRVGSAEKVYKWIANPGILDAFWGKKTWLQEGFMLWRDAIALVLILLLARWQLKQTLFRDQLLLAGKKEEAKKVGQLATARLRFWSAPILVCYALLFSLLSFDLTMSLAPTWFSTLWGGWSFAIMMHTLMAALLLAMFSLKGSPLGEFIGRSQFHDVGKLMHGFTVFFGYLTYAHVLTYWYGNVPEETEYFIHRLHSPWIQILIIAPILSFLFPLFGLLPKVSKWTPVLTLPICGSILFAQWLAYLLVVMPEIVAAEAWSFPAIEIGVCLGVLGLFLLTFHRFGSKNPMLSIADPLLESSMASQGH